MRLSIKYGPFSTDRKASNFYDKLVNFLQAQGEDNEIRGARMSADCRSITAKTKSSSISCIPFAGEITTSVRIHISEYLELVPERRGIVIFNRDTTLAKPYVIRFPDEDDGETASFVFKTSCYQVAMTVNANGSVSYDIKKHVLKDLSKDGFTVGTELIEEGEFRTLSDLELTTNIYKVMLQAAYEKRFIPHKPVAHLARSHQANH